MLSDAQAATVARTVLELYDSLPPKCHPAARNGLLREWTVLSAIGLELADGSIRCLCLAWVLFDVS